MHQLRLLACLLLGTAAASGGNWTKVTMYDVLQEDCRHNVADKDLGDPARGNRVHTLVKRPWPW